MKRLKDVLAALVVISFLMFAFGRLSHAQPNIPRKKIPTNIPSDVREQIERLYSSDPVERARGAYGLEKMGTRAAAAVPFLIEILDDNIPLQWVWEKRNPFLQQSYPSAWDPTSLVWRR